MGGLVFNLPGRAVAQADDRIQAKLSTYMEIYNNDPYSRTEHHNDCLICHQDYPGGPRTDFGLAFAAAGYQITDELRASFPDLFITQPEQPPTQPPTTPTRAAAEFAIVVQDKETYKVGDTFKAYLLLWGTGSYDVYLVWDMNGSFYAITPPFRLNPVKPDEQTPLSPFISGLDLASEPLSLGGKIRYLWPSEVAPQEVTIPEDFPTGTYTWYTILVPAGGDFWQERSNWIWSKSQFVITR